MKRISAETTGYLPNAVGSSHNEPDFFRNGLGTHELPEAVPFQFRLVARASVNAKP